MRQIETQMINAVATQGNWNNANTRVETLADGVTSAVYLHGNLIAQVRQGGAVRLFDGGWQTVTTKSRLNALLHAFCPSARVFAKRGEWFVTNNEETRQFCSGMLVHAF